MSEAPALESPLAVAEAGLARIAGLAPSGVLRGRLERHAALLPALTATPSCDDPAWAALIDAVTVQETRLFRAPSQLAAIAARLPRLATGRPLRILSAGCATGEEAWSLAVLAAAAGLPAEVTGLDLCRPALRVAEAGRYGPGPPTRCARSRRNGTAGSITSAGRPRRASVGRSSSPSAVRTCSNCRATCPPSTSQSAATS
ncbi:CheR family methyltransferase [Roseomonas sp. CCTCC AB2023176]|uniref:CheR family methyltransferase n=1 Tax=Roseomonas sp. CCTCC AB2023176 TaxID=3342640 RepID=UPI0035DBDA2C